MDLYEHQARQLFAEHGIAVPRAEVVGSAARAQRAARRLGGRVVVKAQVKTGGRGKAGGVRMAADPAAAALMARRILGMGLAPQIRAFKVGHGTPRSRGDREELFGGFGASWRGAFVGGELLVRAVTDGPADDRLPGNFPDRHLI